MKVCDKCRKGEVTIILKFKTKQFEICDECAKKLVGWLEKKPLKEQFSNLWEQSKNRGGI